MEAHMPYQEFQENWKLFSGMIDKLSISDNEQINLLVKRYVEQNLMILNDVFATSMENLKKLQHAKTANDVICMQARFTNEINKKVCLSTQRFLNASLGQIADYNEWLKAHCDLSTD
jgi:hypothetical protein